MSGEDPSGRLAWRRKGLIAAANRTGLLLHIEETHKLSDAEVDFVHNITLKNGKNPGGGSAMAWAAHTRVLRQYGAFQKIGNVEKLTMSGWSMRE